MSVSVQAMRRSGMLVRVLCLLLCGLPVVALAQQAKAPVNIGAFIKELLVVKTDGMQQQLALWLPYEFFRECAVADGETPTEDMLVLQQYYPMLIECKIVATDPAQTIIQQEEAIRARATLQVGGKELSPLAAVPESMAKPVAQLTQFMAAVSGEKAENFHIMLFPAQLDGKPLSDIAQRNTLMLTLKADAQFVATTFIWRTPFDVLTPPVTCATCHEKLSAKWQFCPWCGHKIE